MKKPQKYSSDRIRLEKLELWLRCFLALLKVLVFLAVALGRCS